MSYTPTQWSNGDIVTSEKLNKLENGVATNATSPTFRVNFEFSGDTVVCDKTYAEILAAYNAGQFVYGTVADDVFLYLDEKYDGAIVFRKTNYYHNAGDSDIVLSVQWYTVTEDGATNEGDNYKIELMN